MGASPIILIKMVYRITKKEREYVLSVLVIGIAFYLLNNSLRSSIDNIINTYFGGQGLLVGTVLLIALLYFWKVK